MRLEPPFRPATRRDCPQIAELFNNAAGGVPEYVWTSLAGDYPNLTPFEIGVLRCGRDDIPFSYRNTVVAEIDDEVAGILISFPGEDRERERNGWKRLVGENGGGCPIMKPFRELDVPGSYFINSVSLLPQYRGEGLGTRLMELARERAANRGFKKLSLLAFEENRPSLRLYQRLGYRVVDSMPLAPHPLIAYTSGDVLLMVADV